MKRENKKTYTYATRPSLHKKATDKANKEGVSLSQKVHDLLARYVDLDKSVKTKSSNNL